MSGIVGSEGSRSRAIGSLQKIVQIGASDLYKSTTTATTGNINMILLYDGAGTLNGYVQMDTGANSTTWATSSDYRLKENEEIIEGALSVVEDLKPYVFNFKGKTKKQYGFFAHELQIYIPEAVAGEKDQVDENDEIFPQAIDYGRITPVLCKAVQELSTKVTALETENTDIKTKMATLEAKNDALEARVLALESV